MSFDRLTATLPPGSSRLTIGSKARHTKSTHCCSVGLPYALGLARGYGGEVMQTAMLSLIESNTSKQDPQSATPNSVENPSITTLGGALVRSFLSRSAKRHVP